MRGQYGLMWAIIGLLPSLVVVGALAGCETGHDAVYVTDPWILEAPGGAPSMAGYGVIGNGTDRAINVTSVDSPAFERVHLHETRIEGGQAGMSPVDTLTVPPGGRAVMRPGALHLMLMGPVRPLEAGDRAEIRIHLDEGDTLVVQFPVRAGLPD